jgi:hypothetical protein
MTSTTDGTGDGTGRSSNRSSARSSRHGGFQHPVAWTRGLPLVGASHLAMRSVSS